MLAVRSKRSEIITRITLKTVPHASAIIDGTLCQLTDRGLRATEYTPLGSAVVEFRQGPLCIYVREHAYGLLPGLANLYCLDGGLRLRWIAGWPISDDPCAAILGEEKDGSILVAQSASGVIVRLDTSDGRMLSCDLAVRQTG